MSRYQDPAQLPELIAAVALGNQQAYRRLYEATSAKLFAVALRILRDEARAEEVVQDSFVNVWNSAGSYQTQLSAPMTWLITIVRNRCLDALRRNQGQRRNEVELDEDLVALIESDTPGPQDQLLRSEDAASLNICMRKLESGQRQAIAFAYFQGLTHSELAESLKVPMGTVKTWIRRGLEKLKRCLEEGAADVVIEPKSEMK